ncbi:MAG: UDP-N-acetylmuramoyl-L-alanine--D-glutamate ligase [Patescibacteria group bacterium]
MELSIDIIKKKKIGVLGFGAEGKTTFEYLQNHGIEPVIFDQTEKNNFYKKNPEIRSNVKCFLGKKYLKNIAEVDLVFKTPGIPILDPDIQTAIKKGVIFTSQIELFFDQSKANIIGVTGTKGKGTTATLIYEILKRSGKNVYLGGNIGLPAITFLDKLSEQSLVILELSSFQLQSLQKSPKIAVVLNVTKDHLDYHHDVNEYREAKKNIVKFQTKSDYSIINADYPVLNSFIATSKGEILLFSKEKAANGCYIDKQDNIILQTKAGPVMTLNINKLLLRGKHNLENVTAAILASYVAGADINSIQKVVKNFHGLEHRLELVSKKNGVAYYNDSFSTTPETAIAAIKSFNEPIVLILGGSYKGSDYAKLGYEIEKSKVKALILIGEMAAEISKNISTKFIGKRVFSLTKMEEMVKTAAELSKRGDVVLLSPACASFGLFENYKDRGNQFKEAVRKL